MGCSGGRRSSQWESLRLLNREVIGSIPALIGYSI